MRPNASPPQSPPDLSEVGEVILIHSADTGTEAQSEKGLVRSCCGLSRVPKGDAEVLIPGTVNVTLFGKGPLQM